MSLRPLPIPFLDLWVCTVPSLTAQTLSEEYVSCGPDISHRAPPCSRLFEPTEGSLSKYKGAPWNQLWSQPGPAPSWAEGKPRSRCGDFSHTEVQDLSGPVAGAWPHLAPGLLGRNKQFL